MLAESEKSMRQLLGAGVAVEIVEYIVSLAPGDCRGQSCKLPNQLKRPSAERTA